MTETTLTLRVPNALHARVTALAERLGQPFDATLVTALEESVERWEDHLRACDALESGTEEPVLLHVVNE